MSNKSSGKEPLLPFVSICTPTFNRRPFYPAIIRCFESQTYPKDRIEWIIIDDGTDKIEDLVAHIPQVKYFKYNEKMVLGKKRNIMHDKSKGDFIVYMDDDDFYPPDRVSHAVETLQKNPKALCAGSSEMYIYFKHIHKMYQFGPYGPNHATAGTFAFRKELLQQTRYEEGAALAEEKHFLKNYTIPFVQLDPMKTILVFSHVQNTFDKKTLLNGAPNKMVKETTKTVDDFLKDDIEIKHFFMEKIDEALSNYSPGNVENKPDVLKQMAEMTKKREQEQEEYNKKYKEIMDNDPVQTVAAYQQALSEQNVKHQILITSNNQLREKVAYLEGKITEMIQKQISDKKLQTHSANASGVKSLPGGTGSPQTKQVVPPTPPKQNKNK